MPCDINLLVFRKNDGKKTNQSVWASFAFKAA